MKDIIARLATHHTTPISTCDDDDNDDDDGDDCDDDEDGEVTKKGAEIFIVLMAVTLVFSLYLYFFLHL